MKKFFIILLVLITVMIGAVVMVANYYVDEAKIKSVLIEAAKKNGADLTIDSLSFSVLPSPSLDIKTIALAKESTNLTLKIDAIKIADLDLIALLLDKQLSVETIRVEQLAMQQEEKIITLDSLAILLDSNLATIYEKATTGELKNITDPLQYVAWVNANANVTLSNLTFNQYRVDKADTDIRLNNKSLKATINQIALYNGAVIGEITSADITNKQEAVAFDITARKIELAKVSSNKIVKSNIIAPLDATIKGKFHHHTPNLVSTILADGTLNLDNIHIKGYDIPGMLTGNPRAFLKMGDSNALQTHLSDVTGAFTMSKGVLSTDNLQAKTGKLLISSLGNVDLVKQYLDMTLQPTIKANITEPEKKLIPLMIKGPFNKIRFIPDANINDIVKKTVDDTLKSLIQSPENAKKILKEQGKNLEGTGKNIINNFKQLKELRP